MTQTQTDEGAEGPGTAAWWDAHAERLQRRRPRAGGLTVERIVAEALALVDRDGLDALTVRHLAGALGTSSATLYRHVASVDELLVLMIDQVLGEIDLPDADRPARERVTHLAVEFRRVLVEHPGMVPALRASPLLGPNAMRGAESGLAYLLEMGFAPSVAVSGYLALIDYVLGSVFFDTASGGDRSPVGPPRRPAGSQGPLAEGSAVTGARSGSALIVHRDALQAASSAEVFRLGLTAFLDGLEQRHGPHR